ncbi:ficolin-1-A-like [Physella acuta]|uniref:ficolin-1-A-like n=1 Tax=Physella acuta TaxID=109671 RepID=UPI0027DE3838|nr:ficolin-1-A-like [Physella acuta]
METFTPGFVFLITTSFLFLRAYNSDPAMKSRSVVGQVQSGETQQVTLKKNDRSKSTCDYETLTCELSTMSTALPTRMVSKSPDDGSDVLCDTRTDGGGWIIMLRRIKGDVDFNRTWLDYKLGFGSWEGDYWHGLEKIHSLTKNGTWELRIDMRYQGKDYYANYGQFVLFNEQLDYAFYVAAFTGNVLDELEMHTNIRFSTKDYSLLGYKCAQTLGGGWWFQGCGRVYVFLTGLFETDEDSKGIHWDNLTSQLDYLDMAEMKIRKRSSKNYKYKAWAGSPPKP